MDRNHNIETISFGTNAIVRVTGNITSSEESPLPTALDQAAKQGATRIVLHFQPTTYINSAGMALIIGLTIDAQKAGQRVAVCGLSPHLKKMFDVLGMFDHLDLFETEEEALQATQQRKR